jgi:hypothetical protein
MGNVERLSVAMVDADDRLECAAATPTGVPAMAAAIAMIETVRAPNIVIPRYRISPWAHHWPVMSGKQREDELTRPS